VRPAPREEDAMTQEELSRFALQLREAERIRALMAQEADSRDGIPLATELVVEEPRPVSTMVCAA
jgi:hypothetical protein